MWVSNKIEVFSAVYLSFNKDLSSHGLVVTEISMNSLLGTHRSRVKLQRARRLNSKVRRICQSYIDKLEECFEKHNILARLKVLDKKADFPVSKEATKLLEISWIRR